MTPQQPRFKLLRASALGALALVATLAACESALPTAADVAKMDASSATAKAQHFSLIRNPEEVDYYVNGVATTAEDATAIPSEEIAAMRVFKQRSTKAGVEAHHAQIHILTKDAPKEARAAFEKEETAATMQTGPVQVRFSGQATFDGEKRLMIAKVDSIDAVTGAHSAHMTITGGGIPETGAQPIIFIDGVRANAEAMTALDVHSIESVEIIKGEAAVRQYGAEAASGVIRITMKK